MGSSDNVRRRCPILSNNKRSCRGCEGRFWKWIRGNDNEMARWACSQPGTARRMRWPSATVRQGTCPPSQGEAPATWALLIFLWSSAVAIQGLPRGRGSARQQLHPVVAGALGGGGDVRQVRRDQRRGLWTEVCGQQKQSNDPGNNQHILNTPTIGRC